MNQRPLPCVLAGFVLGEVWIIQFYGTAASAAFLFGAIIPIWMWYQNRGSTFFVTYRILILGICIGLLAGGMRTSIWMKQKSSFAEWKNGEEMDIYGQILDYTHKDGKTTIVLKVLSIRNQSAEGKVLLYFDEIKKYPLGGTMKIKGEISEFKIPTNPGEFDQKKYQEGKGIWGSLSSPEVQDVRYGGFLLKDGVMKIRNLLAAHIEANMSEEKSSIAMAMLLGDKTFLTEEQKSLYESGGISHVLAVSGLHMTLIGAGLYKIFRRIGFSYGISVGVSFPMIVFYAVLTGMSSSCLRASLMLVVYLIAEWKGYCYDLPSSLSLAGILLLMEIPERIYDSGFLLSFSAMLSIGLFVPFLCELLGWKMGKHKIMDSIISSSGLLLFTLPVSLYFFYGVSIIGIILNLIVIPCMSLLMPFLLVGSMGIAGFMPELIWKTGFLLAELVLELYEILCKIGERIPFGYAGIGYRGIFFAAIYYGILLLGIFILYKMKKKMGRILFVPLLCSLILLIFVTDRTESFCTFLDVGQGDGILYQASSGELIMVDGGSSSKKNIGSYILKPAMEYYGHTGVDYWFVSHMDQDHISGLQELLEKNFRVETLVLPITERGEDHDLISLAKENGTRILYMKKGDMLTIGEEKFICLHPSEKEIATDKNENSLVLLFETNNQQLLFTGDVENAGETKMSEYLKTVSGSNKKEKLLKVSHHGSANGTKEKLLDVFWADVAVVSCGKNNRYGHPSEEVIKRLHDYGIPLLKTTECGAIEIIMKEQMKIFQYGP